MPLVVPVILPNAIAQRRAGVTEAPPNRADRWRSLIDAQHTHHWVRANLAKHAAVHLTNVDRVERPPAG